jgi:hypothetical protein
MIMRKSTNYRRPARAIRAAEEIETSDLVLDVQDVVDLLSEVTGEEIEAEVNEDTVDFTVGEEVFTIEAEGEPIIEQDPIEESRKVSRRPVSASRTARKTSGRPLRTFRK